MHKMPLGRGNLRRFAGSDSGGERAAARCTIVQTCQLNGLNPEACREDSLTRIAKPMPWRMTAASSAPSR